MLIILSTILIINLYIITIHLALKNDLPKVFGFAQIIIQSGSMQPAMDVGDMLIIREMDNYQKGDIVTFREGKVLITHKIISIDDNTKRVVTQGNKNNVADEPITMTQIEGKVFLRIKNVGDFIVLLKTPMGIFLMTLMVIVLVEYPYMLDKIKALKKIYGDENKHE